MQELLLSLLPRAQEAELPDAPGLSKSLCEPEHRLLSLTTLCLFLEHTTEQGHESLSIIGSQNGQTGLVTIIFSPVFL